MRVPPFERFTRLMQAGAYIVLGSIIGAMIYHAIFFMNFNALRNSNTALEDKLIDYEDRIEKLNKFKDQHTVIQSVQPILLDNKNGDGASIANEQDKKALKSKLKADLSVFVGTSIYKINSNAELSWDLLDRKIYAVEGKEFVVQIRTMLVVDNVLQVWFKAALSQRQIN
ncbi:hypothetical protein [Paenibacillus sp. CF384]|uniref:hypothetical protein n=1 Tax=Paenibacillus sp. CF384 TaxID=1884382 RepID=UPI00089546D9|nr:hypothetical protein [Paenibacillus sp. CF384]SDX19748.1 hypothetical protein SAMN05518855_101076 [Paenibacillus sp. CF384]